jgi:predicted RNase H-like HicB family nuclease
VRYPIAIEIGTESTAYGVVVPDLPGCFSAGETIDYAVIAAEEAATAWIEATLDAGGTVPAPSSIETLRAQPEYAGWAFGCLASLPSIPPHWIAQSSACTSSCRVASCCAWMPRPALPAKAVPATSRI